MNRRGDEKDCITGWAVIGSKRHEEVVKIGKKKQRKWGAHVIESVNGTELKSGQLETGTWGKEQ